MNLTLSMLILISQNVTLHGIGRHAKGLTLSEWIIAKQQTAPTMTAKNTSNKENQNLPIPIPYDYDHHYDGTLLYFQPSQSH